MKRTTHQRETVLETAMELSGSHPTADTIYDRVRALIPSVSRATVYRILNQCADEGAVQRLHFPESADRYDNRTDRHYHLRCGCCGAIVDIDAPDLDKLCARASETSEADVTGFNIIFYGKCKVCKNAASN